MKLNDLEDGHIVATKLDLQELSLEIREFRVEIKEQFNKIKLLIWLPVIAAIGQVLFILLHK